MLGFCHLLEAELGHFLLHQTGYLGITQIADAALMGMMHFLGMMELACFILQPYLLVGISERHTLQNQFVNSLNGKDGLITRVIQDMGVYTQTTYNIGSHSQTILEFVESWEENFLQYLIVTEIPTWQVVADKYHLLRKSLQLVALGTCKLKHIRIFLMRHDAGACGALIRQFHKTKVLTVKHAGVESQFGDGAGDACQNE